MTDSEIFYIVLIGTATMFVLVTVFLTIYVRAYSKKLKSKKTKINEVLSDKILSQNTVDFLSDDVFKTTKQPFCRCLYEIENKLPRTKFCHHACRDQIKILSRRDKSE